MAHILAIEPFFTGSHRSWLEGLSKASKHQFSLFTLPGRHWKWRMHGAAISFAEQLKSIDKSLTPDLILSTDMLDLATFKALLPKRFRDIPIIHYFHENQMTYPWSKDDQDRQNGRDQHYAFINLTSALAADYLLFNSYYHKKNFLNSIPLFLKRFPDENTFLEVEQLKSKSEVLPIGVHLPSKLQRKESPCKEKLIVWNHRWEYDKNPHGFLEALRSLKKENILFKLAVLGEQTSKIPPPFIEIEKLCKNDIIQWGMVHSKEQYWNWLQMSDLSIVTSQQDFFGISAIESLAAGVPTLLPRRLAYPEHLSKKYKSFLYEHPRELIDKSIHFLQRPLPLHQRQELFDMVDCYSWKNIISRYDLCFQKMLENN